MSRQAALLHQRKLLTNMEFLSDTSSSILASNSNHLADCEVKKKKKSTQESLTDSGFNTMKGLWRFRPIASLLLIASPSLRRVHSIKYINPPPHLYQFAPKSSTRFHATSVILCSKMGIMTVLVKIPIYRIRQKRSLKETS